MDREGTVQFYPLSIQACGQRGGLRQLGNLPG